MPLMMRNVIFSSIIFTTCFVLTNQSRADGYAETLYHGKQEIFTLPFLDRHYLTAETPQYLFFKTINNRDLEIPPETYPEHLGVSDNNDYWGFQEHNNNIGDLVALDVHFAMGVVHDFHTNSWGTQHWPTYPILSYVNVCCEDHGASYFPQTNKIEYYIASENQRYSTLKTS